MHGIRAIFGKSELAMKADQVDAAGAHNYMSLDEPSSWAGNNIPAQLFAYRVLTRSEVAVAG